MCKWWEMNFVESVCARPSEPPLFAVDPRIDPFMSCFPRLHVYDDPTSALIQTLYSMSNAGTQMVYPAAFRPTTIKSLWRIQLPMMLTSIHDDTPELRSLASTHRSRCRCAAHLFDVTERPVWRSWRGTTPALVHSERQLLCDDG